VASSPAAERFLASSPAAERFVASSPAAERFLASCPAAAPNFAAAAAAAPNFAAAAAATTTTFSTHVSTGPRDPSSALRLCAGGRLVGEGWEGEGVEQVGEGWEGEGVEQVGAQGWEERGGGWGAGEPSGVEGKGGRGGGRGGERGSGSAGASFRFGEGVFFVKYSKGLYYNITGDTWYDTRAPRRPNKQGWDRV